MKLTHHQKKTKIAKMNKLKKNKNEMKRMKKNVALC